MNSELDKTKTKRHQKIVYCINEIWKLEKEKFILRERLESIRGEIMGGVQANSIQSQSPGDKAWIANITIARKKETSEKKFLEEIRNQQRIFLKKIEAIIDI